MRIPCLPERFLTDAFPVLKMMGVSKAFDTPIIGLRRGRRSLLLRESEHVGESNLNHRFEISRRSRK